MKVLQINTLARGGAARACINLHLGLLQQGVDSNLLLLEEARNIRKSANYWSYHENTILPEIQKRPLKQKVKDKVLFALGRNKYAQYLEHRKMMKEIDATRNKQFEVFTSPLSLCEITKHPLYKQADIVHLHWVNNFLDYEEFFSNNTKPLFWTLHEMFPFTGGCSFSMECRQFEQACIRCPQLAKCNQDYVRYLFNYKKRNLEKNKTSLTIITPSKWLGKNSQQSKILGAFPHVVIPYSIEHEFFNYRVRETAKKQLGIEEGKSIILFVSDNVNNHRKGTQYIFPIIEKLSREPNLQNLLFITVGGGDLSLGSNHKHLGLITSTKDMATIYAAADVFICPSLEDNFPNTILESLLVGTPTIGFPSGGIPEMIEPEKSGMVVPRISSESLYDTILDWYHIKDKFNYERIAADAREKYKLDVQAKKVIDLYKQVL
jgi:glycosyltransferase involved in cell wall biosynthesis